MTLARQVQSFEFQEASRRIAYHVGKNVEDAADLSAVRFIPCAAQERTRSKHSYSTLIMRSCVAHPQLFAEQKSNEVATVERTISDSRTASKQQTGAQHCVWHSSHRQHSCCGDSCSCRHHPKTSGRQRSFAQWIQRVVTSTAEAVPVRGGRTISSAGTPDQVQLAELVQRRLTCRISVSHVG